jgi:hypothetical protein
MTVTRRKRETVTLMLTLPEVLPQEPFACPDAPVTEQSAPVTPVRWMCSQVTP